MQSDAPQAFSEAPSLARLTGAVESGRHAEAHELLPLVYAELRRIAGARVARMPEGFTLAPTEVVHEAYVRLVRKGADTWEGRRHFFASAARAVREVVVEHARRRGRLKRGGADVIEPIEVTLGAPDAPVSVDDLIALDGALSGLAADHPRCAAVVELQYFLGMSAEQVAEVLDVSARTAERDWRFARAWLHAALDAEAPRP